jgi:hypothetical protein
MAFARLAAYVIVDNSDKYRKLTNIHVADYSRQHLQTKELLIQNCVNGSEFCFSLVGMDREALQRKLSNGVKSLRKRL